MVIGIGGMSRSGKTWLAHEIGKLYGQTNAVVLSLDDYAVPEKDIPMIRDMVDWEHPESIDFDRLYLDVFDASHVFNLVIVEGFLIFLHEPIRKLLNKKICISIPRDVFEQRRKKTVF